MFHRTRWSLLALLPTALFGAAALAAPPPQQVIYRVVQPRTAIPATVAVPREGFALRDSSFSYASARNYGMGDFNGDGLEDFIVAPQSIQPPVDYFPVEVWLNNGDHSFRKATVEVIDGVVPRPVSTNEIFVRDFNEDGRADAMFIDSGVEYAVDDEDKGAVISLLLSQPNGKLIDATANITPNPKTFNHGEGVGDFNGDGHLDIAVSRFAWGEPNITGVALLLGDGHGSFVQFTEGLSEDIRYMDRALRVAQDWQDVSCTTLASLDGDNRDDVVTGSGGGRDPGPDPRTIRFYKSMADGTAVEQGRVNIPDAIADIGRNADTVAEDPNGWGLGCAQIAPGDINGDGRDDLVVNWEGEGKTYVEVLRNDGYFQFTDITISAVGSYSTSGVEDGTAFINSKHRLMDINGDRSLDLVYLLNGNSVARGLQSTALLNDGTGHFTPLVPQDSNGPITASQVTDPSSPCPGCSQETLFIRTTRGGLPSIVFKDKHSDQVAGPPAQTNTLYLTVLAPEPPTLSIADAAITEGNSGTRFATFTARLSYPAPSPVTYNIATANGTARAGSDYVARSQSGLTIAAGSKSRTFAVTINGDSAVEATERFKVNLSNATGATILDGQATGTILNDDGPTLSIADVTISEGNSGTKLAKFTVTLSQATASAVTYNVATANGTATVGSDYVGWGLTGRTIAAGLTSQTLSVRINGDAAVEADETFKVKLSNSAGATILHSQATGTILNDD